MVCSITLGSHFKSSVKRAHAESLQTCEENKMWQQMIFLKLHLTSSAIWKHKYVPTRLSNNLSTFLFAYA